MRVGAVNFQCAVNPVKFPKQGASKVSKAPRVISFQEYFNRPVSFTGKDNRNKEQVIFIGAESAPYSKAGGVGVVMKDYRSLLPDEDNVQVLPYYGAGEDKDGATAPVKDKEGNWVLPNGDVKLELISEKKLQVGKSQDEDIKLFKIKDDKDKSTYFVYTPPTGKMQKPYDGNFTYRSGAKAENNGWWGDPYAEFSKAAVQFLPEIIKDKSEGGKEFDPATIVCSDSQTALVPHYMAQMSEKDPETYGGVKSSYIGHNLGSGYCGETSKQNMFVDLGATPEQIEKIEADPIYQQGLLGDDYFTPFVEDVLDETGAASAVMVPIYYAKKDRANGEGYVKTITAVSEEYAKSLAENPETAPNIHNHLKELYKDGVFTGIVNPLNDSSLDPTKPVPNKLYTENCTDEDGTVYPKFKTYPENATYDQMREVKNYNKALLLRRFSAKDTSIAAGTQGKSLSINPEAKGVYDGPVVREDLIEKIENGQGDEVPLFVSWGRADTQKGHNVTLSAFEKFAKTEEGKDAILILGAQLDSNPEARKIEEKVTEMLKDPDLQGRIIHLDGWAPGYAMASAADAAIFSSRFEPCGLTDLEAMKYYCTPIVTNTQGLKQKNFDPRLEHEAAKATSYKTTHEYDLLKSQVEPIIKGYADGNEEAKEEVKREFPVFGKDGEYDDSAFVRFGEEYNKFIQSESKAPDKEAGWNDWDNLNRTYSFRYQGFARGLKDEILTAEMADAISACVKADKSTKETIFKNIQSTDTSWNNNGMLTPSGKSSAQLYKELHFDPDYSAPTEGDILNVSTETIDDTIEKRQSGDLKERLGSYVAGALTGAAGILAARGKLSNKEVDRKVKEFNGKIAEMAEASRRDAETIKGLQAEVKRLTQVSKRNAIIAGAAGAAAIVALITTGIVSHNKQKKLEATNGADTLVISNPPQMQMPAAGGVANTEPAGQGTIISPNAFSLDKFKGNLVNA